MTLKEKIADLKEELENIQDNYVDSFKTDIQFTIGDFDTTNPKLNFLTSLKSKTEITSWIDKLLSRVVMKFDEECESLNDFINDYLELG
jgi:hypothetical protein